MDKEMLFHTMNAADEMHANAPDGAWQAAIEETVTWWNQENGTDYDETDTFQEWLKWHAEQEQVDN